MVILYWAAAIFGYIFTCVIADKVMGASKKGDEILALFWPVILLIYVVVYLPVRGMIWIVNKAPKSLPRRKSVSEVK